MPIDCSSPADGLCEGLGRPATRGRQLRVQPLHLCLGARERLLGRRDRVVALAEGVQLAARLARRASSSSANVCAR